MAPRWIFTISAKVSIPPASRRISTPPRRRPVAAPCSGRPAIASHPHVEPSCATSRPSRLCSWRPARRASSRENLGSPDRIDLIGLGNWTCSGVGCQSAGRRQARFGFSDFGFCARSLSSEVREVLPSSLLFSKSATSTLVHDWSLFSTTSVASDPVAISFFLRSSLLRTCPVPAYSRTSGGIGQNRSGLCRHAVEKGVDEFLIKARLRPIAGGPA